MNETLARRLTGLAGITAAAALMIEVPLYFVYSGPPPDANVLTRLLLAIFSLAFLIVIAHLPEAAPPPSEGRRR